MRVPSKLEITDFKKGYYDTTIDKATTFTAIGYNKNGSTRGIPITVIPNLTTGVITLDGNRINIATEGSDNIVFNYNIVPIIPNSTKEEIKGTTDGSIDISILAKGYYVLTICNENEGIFETFKFNK